MNQYDYGARVYDPRAGRFLSVDPISRDYPGLTPYQFASNTPIWASDLDGLEADYSPVKAEKQKRDEYGHWLLNYMGNSEKISYNMGVSAYNQVIDLAEDGTNVLTSSKGREQVALKYGASFLAYAEFGEKFKNGEISFEQLWQATKEFFKNPDNIEDLGGSVLLSLLPLPKIKLPTSFQIKLKPLARLFEGLGKKDIEIPLSPSSRESLPINNSGGKPPSRAPEFKGGQVTESGFIKSALQWLGKGYKDLGKGRYVSKDGLKQVRYGKHETTGNNHHGHFEIYDKPVDQGGKVIENTSVNIVTDN